MFKDMDNFTLHSADKIILSTYVDMIFLQWNKSGGGLYIFGCRCAAGALKPLPYTRLCSADFATLY